MEPDDVRPERVVVYTRAGCHLCDDAIGVVAAVCGDAGVAWRTVDVDADPQLVEAYGEYVPVVTVDGVQQGFWRIDAGRLARLLSH